MCDIHSPSTGCLKLCSTNTLSSGLDGDVSIVSRIYKYRIYVWAVERCYKSVSSMVSVEKAEQSGKPVSLSVYFTHSKRTIERFIFYIKMFLR